MTPIVSNRCGVREQSTGRFDLLRIANNVRNLAQKTVGLGDRSLNSGIDRRTAGVIPARTAGDDSSAAAAG